MIDVRRLLDLPNCRDAANRPRRVKALGSQSRGGGRYHVVYDVTEGEPALSVLDAASRIVTPLDPQGLRGVEFEPTNRNAVELVFAWAQELSEKLPPAAIAMGVTELFQRGAITIAADGTSDLVQLADLLLVTQAVSQLYMLGVIGGESLMQTLLAYGVEFSGHGSERAAGIADEINRLYERWQTSAIKPLSAADHQHIIRLVTGVAVLANTQSHKE